MNQNCNGRVHRKLTTEYQTIRLIDWLDDWKVDKPIDTTIDFTID